MEKTQKELFSEIKGYGWSTIALTKKGYRGAIQAYKNVQNEKVAVMFYLDECFIIEDSQGLFRVEDLKDFFMKEHKEIDLEATGCIEGLSLIAYLDENKKVMYMTQTMERLGLNTYDIVEDIEKRLNLVNQLAEEVDVDMGFGKPDIE